MLCAVLGAILALNGHTSLTVGTLVSFLALSKGFSQPVARVSQQLNSIVMAAAGDQVIVNGTGAMRVTPKGIHEPIRLHDIIGYGKQRLD